MGADALLVVTPYYNKTSQAGLIKHYHMIADSVNIPIIVYNVPSRTGCAIQPQTYVELAKASEYLRNKGSERKYKRYCADDSFMRRYD